MALSSGVVMTTSGEQYDGVADLYLAADELLIRTAAERPAFLARLGDVRGLECLDLACGSGFIARILMEQGARHVVGVDSSPEQIAVARRSTRRA